MEFFLDRNRLNRDVPPLIISAITIPRPNRFWVKNCSPEWVTESDRTAFTLTRVYESCPRLRVRVKLVYEWSVHSPSYKQHTCNSVAIKKLVKIAVLWSRDQGLVTRVHSSSFFKGLGHGLETRVSRSWSWSRDQKAKVLVLVSSNYREGLELGLEFLRLVWKL